MTATNHTLTGVLVGALLPNPFISIPIAFLLHFVLDGMPHFDFLSGRKSKKLFAVLLVLDMCLAASILLAVAITQPEHWVSMIAAGIACASPDLMWLPGYIRNRAPASWEPPKARPVLMRFHKKIQWCERSWGFWIELVWAAGVLALLREVTF